jgi:hypothetical protein
MNFTTLEDTMKNSRQGIYVEVSVRGGVDDLWQKTQTPALHRRWDLRFTDIEYLPRPDESQPQQFCYTTRIGFGLRIGGKGETVGNYDDENGCRTSALKFWSDDPRSLILKGSGYWKYIPNHEGIRFLTWYDYQTRFGILGRLFDRQIFRPLIGWATAWSFDRLRLWIEKSIDPVVSLRNSVIHAIARTIIAIIWLYHGLVPKLIFPSNSELALFTNAGFAYDAALVALRLLGIGEILLGLTMLVAWHWRWLFLVNVGLLCLASLGVIVTSPAYLVEAFNSVILNLATLALALIGLVSSSDLPSSRHCLRQPKGT